MKKILIPIDGTEKSLEAIDLAKSVYPPGQAEMFLLFVREDIQGIGTKEALAAAEGQTGDIAQSALRRADGYARHIETIFGVAGKEIVSYALQNEVDMIVVASATKAGLMRKIGSVTSYILRNARCPVLVLPGEQPAQRAGVLCCEQMEDIIILSGQLGFSHSACLLPVRVGRCRYEITVLDGNLRLSHLAFNPDGYTWSSPPWGHQPPHYDIAAGQKEVIELEAFVSCGQLDRIEVVNTHLEKQLRFHYQIAFLE